MTFPVPRYAVLLLTAVAVALPAAKSTKTTKKKSSPAANKAAQISTVRKAQAKLSADWYASLKERLTDIPTDELKGRVIVIDPGHISCSPGASGPKGKITEAEVNWGVARRLAKLLNDAGAKAILTVDSGPPVPLAQRDMSADLDRRAQKSNDNKADLFVSIHHNWGASMYENNTQVYYRIEDPGPSRDAGNFVLQHFTRNLGLEGVLLPGNYKVLRVNRRPAILTEAAYMSNPIQESLLALPAKQELEAQALYLGIADYFAHGTPTLELRTAPGDIAGFARPQLKVKVMDKFGADIKTAQGFFDDRLAQANYDARDTSFTVIPANKLANGKHIFRFEMRNLKGNAAMPLVDSFFTDREPSRITITAHPRICPPGEVTMEVRALVLDREGEPVASTHRVNFSVDGKSLGDSALRNGVARIYLSRAKPGPVTIVARAGRASASITATFGKVATPLVQFQVFRQDGPQAIPGAEICDDWRNDTTRANDDGIALLQPAIGHHRFTITAPGLQPALIELDLKANAALRQEVRLAPLLDGALQGARVFLDPAGNYEEPDTTQELVAFNMLLARRLARLIARAGGTTSIARNASSYQPRTERVSQAIPLRPDNYLKFSAALRDPVRNTRVGHYPDSEQGKRLAGIIARQFALLPALSRADTGSDRSYEVVNAPCPAVGVYLRFADTLKDVSADTVLADEVSRALLLALAQMRGASLPGALHLSIVDAYGKPVKGAQALIDDLLPLYPDAAGKASLTGLSAGVHRLQVSAPGLIPVYSQFEITPSASVVSRTINLKKQ